MNTRAWLVAAGIGALALAGNSGCVSLDRLRQEEMANRNLQAHNKQLQEEKFHADAKADALERELASRNRELEAKQQTIDNLESRLAEADRARDQAQAALEKFAERGFPNDAIVINQALPPALHDAVQRFAQQHPDLLDYLPDKGAVRWKADLLFELGSDVVREAAKSSLGGFAEIVNSQAAAGFDALIAGHTDNKPIRRPQTKALHPTNWHLSTHRAISVVRVLKGLGLAETRMGALGYSEWRPVSDNAAGAAAQAQNRRVEIFLVPRDRSAGGSAPAAAAPSAPEATAKAE